MTRTMTLVNSPSQPRLSVAIITLNEEANLARTLQSVAFADEIIIVDAGSTDRTQAIAIDHQARFFFEPWRGFGAQKNFALGKCTGEWILSLDADEEVSPELATAIQKLLSGHPPNTAFFVARRNLFLGKWMKHGGYYPDRKLRLIKRGAALFEERTVHETLQYTGLPGVLDHDLVHHAYPTLQLYIEHMDRYSTLAAAQFVRKYPRISLFRFINGVILNPFVTFLYNYVIRLGCLDGREGLLQHLYHSVYVSWKYAKIWESSKN